MLSSLLWLPVVAFAVCVAGDASLSTREDGNLLQQLAELPSCATQCLSTTITASSCTFGDLSCLCRDEVFIESTGACVLANCTVREALTTQKWEATACENPVRNVSSLTKKVVWVMFTVTTLAVGFRLLARLTFLEGNLGWDDYAIFASYAALIPCTVIIQIMITRGLGQDIWMVSFNGITDIVFWFYVEEYLYLFIVGSIKIGIVLLYLRLIPGSVSPRFRTVCLTMIGVLICFFVAFTIVLGFECRPVSYVWNQWDGEHTGHCPVNVEADVYSNAGINIFFDLIVIAMPIPRLLKLQVHDTKKKILVVCTFLVGLFATICSIIRLKYLAQFGKSSNLTYHYADVAIWSAVEGYVGVICACMPTIAGPAMHYLRKKVRPAISGASRSKKSITGGNSIRLDRMPSTSSERPLEKPAGKGGISKTVTATMYHMPYDANSSEDVEMSAQTQHSSDSGSQSRTGLPSYRHEYTDAWR